MAGVWNLDALRKEKDFVKSLSQEFSQESSGKSMIEKLGLRMSLIREAAECGLVKEACVAIVTAGEKINLGILIGILKDEYDWSEEKIGRLITEVGKERGYSQNNINILLDVLKNYREEGAEMVFLA